MERTEDQILTLGEGCNRVLTDDVFNQLFREYSDASLAAIVASQPHEVKAREFEYSKLQALIGFSNFLAGFVEAAESIRNRVLSRSDEDE